MKPSTIGSKPGSRLGMAAVAACLVAGCHAGTATAPLDEGVIKTTRTASSLINEGGPVFGKPADASLINEGGPVFAKPAGDDLFQQEGQVLLPRYFTGTTAGMQVSAERLDGGAFPDINASAVGADGSFKLQGPATNKYFFASASFTYEDTTHRVRSLARAGQDPNKLTLDTASTLLAAKVALAEQKRHLFTIDYQETEDLGNQVRLKLGAQLQAVQLDAANAELSNALNVLARKDDTLRDRLRSWEYALDPTLAPTPETALPAGPTGGAAAPTTSSGGSPGSNVK